MVSNEKYYKHEGAEIGFWLIYGVFMSIILPLFIGLSLKGFSESFVSGRALQFGDFLVSYMIYYIFIVAALFVVIYPLMNLLTIRKGQHPATQENPKWYRIFTVSLIHNPEKGGLYTLFRKFGLSQRKNPLRWTLSLFHMFLIGSIIFGFLGILSLTFPQAQVIGIPTNSVLQQVTETTQVMFAVEPASFSETGTMLFIFSLLMGIVAYFVAKFQLGIGVFFLIGFLFISPLIGLLWTFWHLAVYGASSSSLFFTFIFGWIGSTLTLAFGSVIFWLNWHTMNNLFAKLREIAPGNQDVIFIAWLIWGTVAFIYLMTIIFLANRKRKKRLNQVEEPRY